MWRRWMRWRRVPMVAQGTNGGAGYQWWRRVPMVAQGTNGGAGYQWWRRVPMVAQGTSGGAGYQWRGDVECRAVRDVTLGTDGGAQFLVEFLQLTRRLRVVRHTPPTVGTEEIRRNLLENKTSCHKNPCKTRNHNLPRSKSSCVRIPPNQLRVEIYCPG